MRYQGIMPVLYTSDVPGSRAFYTKVLGFGCEDESAEVAFLSRDDVSVMLSVPNAHLPFDTPRFTGSLYIRCDDVDAVWSMVKDDANVCYPIEDFEYGMREFAVYDNNGYLIQFGQEIEG